MLEGYTFSSLFVSFLVLIFTSFLFGIFLRKKKRDVVLFCGPIGSGKTTLYYALEDPSRLVETVMSMQENVRILDSNSKDGIGCKITLVDLPGSPSLRFLMQKYAKSCMAIVFVIDSVDFLPKVTMAAEHLLDLMTMPEISKPRIPILVACNKSERVTAHATDFLKRRLEKEIQQLRTTRQSLVQEVGSKSKKEDSESVGKHFTFADCRNKIEFARISVYKGDIAAVENFVLAGGKR